MSIEYMGGGEGSDIPGMPHKVEEISDAVPERIPTMPPEARIDPGEFREPDFASEDTIKVVDFLPTAHKLALFQERLGFNSRADFARTTKTHINTATGHEVASRRAINNYLGHIEDPLDQESSKRALGDGQGNRLYQRVIRDRYSVEEIVSLGEFGSDEETVRKRTTTMLQSLAPDDPAFSTTRTVGPEEISDEEMYRLILKPSTNETDDAYSERIAKLNLPYRLTIGNAVYLVNRGILQGLYNIPQREVAPFSPDSIDDDRFDSITDQVVFSHETSTYMRKIATGERSPEAILRHRAEYGELATRYQVRMPKMNYIFDAQDNTVVESDAIVPTIPDGGLDWAALGPEQQAEARDTVLGVISHLSDRYDQRAPFINYIYDESQYSIGTGPDDQEPHLYMVGGGGHYCDPAAPIEPGEATYDDTAMERLTRVVLLTGEFNRHVPEHVITREEVEQRAGRILEHAQEVSNSDDVEIFTQPRSLLLQFSMRLLDADRPNT